MVLPSILIVFPIKLLPWFKKVIISEERHKSSLPLWAKLHLLLDEGVMLGFSWCWFTPTTSEGHKVVGEDFLWATAADIVADPSAPDAFVNGIMEGKEWVWEGGILREQLAEQTKKRINTLVDQRALEEHKLNLFNNFLSNL